MNKDYVISIYEELVKLKNILKCSICSDIAGDIAELDCGHRFCNSCFNKQKLKEFNICCLCKQNIKRRSMFNKDEFGNLIGTFVSKVSRSIENNDSLTFLVEKLNKNKQSSSYENQNHNNVPCSSKDSAFDRLLNTAGNLSVNKKGTKQKYSNKKKGNDEENKYKILQFNNNDNKEAVLQWLNDTKNQFNRLTQTQTESDDMDKCSLQTSITDLPSVSQDIPTKSKKPKKSKSKVKMIRSKSLDLNSNKDIKAKEQLSHLGIIENYSIEENTEDILKKAEENALRNIENKYLAALEESLENSNSKTPKSNNPDPQTTQSISSGWNRIEKISKSLKKKKKLKKLNINLVPMDVTNLKNDEKQMEINSDEILSIGKISESLEKKIPNVTYNPVNSKKSKNFKQVKNNAEEVVEPHKKILIEKESKDENEIVLHETNTKDNDTSLEVILKEIEANKVEKVVSHEKQLEEKETKAEKEVYTENKSNIGNTTDINCEDMDIEYLVPTQKIDSNEKNQSLSKSEAKFDTFMELDTFQNIIESLMINFNQNLYKKITPQNIKIIHNHLNKLSEIYYSSKTFPTSEVNAIHQTTPAINDYVCDIADLITDDEMEASVEECQNKIHSNKENVSNQQSETNPHREVYDGFSESLNVDYDTQALLKQNLKENVNPSKAMDKINNNSQKIVICDGSDDRKSQLAQTLNKDENNGFSDSFDLNFDTQDLINKNLKEKLSRSNKSMNNLEIKINSSNMKRKFSDENSVKQVAKKMRNRFIQDELTVDFGVSEKLNSSVTLDTDDEENEQYLNNILKKYESGVVESLSSKANNEKKSQQIIENADHFYNSASTPKNDFEDDNLFLDEKNLSQFEKDIRLYNKGLESSQVIKVTQRTPVSQVNPLNSSKAAETRKSTYCEELEDSLNEDDFKELLDNEKVTICDNVPKSNDDDLFSDEDIVENTPQKEKSSTQRSVHNASLSLLSMFNAMEKSDQLTDGENLVGLIPPPTGFQDNNDEVANDFRLLEESTPKKVLQSRESESKIHSVKNISHSTPRSQFISQKETIGLSPILLEKTLVSTQNEATPRKWNIMTRFAGQKSILNYVKESSVVVKQKPCIACTRLSKDQVQSIHQLSSKGLASYSANFNDTVTHMIVSVGSDKILRDYTMKFVSSVASGIWVLSFDWIKDCLSSNSIISEEPYEILDDTGNSGPKTARLQRNNRVLFKDFQFYCNRPLHSVSVEDVEEVIKKLGGTTINIFENLFTKNDKVKLILTEATTTQETQIYEQWLENYKLITVDLEWLSKSVGRYKILNLRPFIWYSDDLLDHLDYPSYLIENINSTITQ